MGTCVMAGDVAVGASLGRVVGLGRTTPITFPSRTQLSWFGAVGGEGDELVGVTHGLELVEKGLDLGEGVGLRLVQ